jgi:hypothetical protein
MLTARVCMSTRAVGVLEVKESCWRGCYGTVFLFLFSGVYANFVDNLVL